MKKVIHVPRRFSQQDWGGTESVLLNLCRQQQRQGFAPEIHSSQALCATPNEFWQEIPIRRYGYCYPFFGLSEADKRALDLKGGNLLSLELYKALKNMPDVRIFHAHVIKRMGGAVMKAARAQGKPFVVTLHGNVFDVPEAEAQSITAHQENHFEWGKIFGAWFRSRTLLEEADAVICVGHSEFEAARAQLPHERIHYLPNGVDPEKFAGGDRMKMRQELGISAEARVFGCISRIDPQKGQGTLVGAFTQVHAQDPAAHLIIAGPVSHPGFETELRQLVENSPAKQNIHWLPAVAPESGQHRDLLAALDVFVLPSRHEPFGIVVLEAWAAGLPVIVSRVGGLQRLVSDEQDGIFATPGDPASFATHMRSISKERGAALAAAGQKKIEAGFTWEAVAQQQEAIYAAAETYRAQKQ